MKFAISLVQFSHSVMSDSLWPHESQHARPPSSSPTLGIHSNSRPSSQWGHPAISSSVVPFSSCPQSLPASESFSMSWLLASHGQSIGASASASVLPVSSQELTGVNSLQSKGLSRVFSSTVQKCVCVMPFSSCPQSFPASGSFPMSQFFTSGGQSIGASASASVLPMNIQGWFPLGLTALISLLSKALSRVFSNTTVQNHQFFGAQPPLWSNSHIHTWPLEKP